MARTKTILVCLPAFELRLAGLGGMIVPPGVLRRFLARHLAALPERGGRRTGYVIFLMEVSYADDQAF
jgi:hypothetical protein